MPILDVTFIVVCKTGHTSATWNYFAASHGTESIPPMKLVAQLIEQQIGFLTFLTTDAKVMHRELVQTESGIKLFLIVNNKAEELSLVEVSAVPPNLIRCD